MRFRTVSAVVGLCLLAGCDPTGPECLPDDGWSADHPGYIVRYHREMVTPSTTDELVEKYDLTLRLVFPGDGGFSADMSRSAYHGLRCEPVVSVISPNGEVGLYDVVGAVEAEDGGRKTVRALKGGAA